ncbi:hypothetical protein AVEN_50160-1 [Araneus ventricosus]|uniref:Uncharacterized protein n=1 Tax=Araneus ventricosus TaxID=182803 RepID=A0A4Y2U709_ARAVE|nr:hypothetical protein AVEN_50160-1 [Araneus ventricosus]
MQLDTDACISVMSEYPDVFKEIIGKCKGFKATLYVKENCQPKFFKQRPFLYSIQSRVKNEVKRLVDMEILERIEKSDWATPIDPVIKPDGNVRIFGDFKVILNPVLEDIDYPLPGMKDIFVKLSDGKFFSEN